MPHLRSWPGASAQKRRETCKFNSAGVSAVGGINSQRDGNGETRAVRPIVAIEKLSSNVPYVLYQSNSRVSKAVDEVVACDGMVEGRASLVNSVSRLSACR